MKISIARALKEKNRIVGEMRRLNAVIISKNAMNAIVNSDANGNPILSDSDKDRIEKNEASVKNAYSEYNRQRERLISIKTEITKANSGIANELVAMSEAKSRLTELNSVRTGYDTRNPYGAQNQINISLFVFDCDWFENEKKHYTDIINALQDKIDEFNATHYIEFDV